jgi:hypothetical protein
VRDSFHSNAWWWCNFAAALMIHFFNISFSLFIFVFIFLVIVPDLFSLGTQRANFFLQSFNCTPFLFNLLENKKILNIFFTKSSTDSIINFFFIMQETRNEPIKTSYCG